MNEDIAAKYKQLLEKELQVKATKGSGQVYSREYQVFRTEILPPRVNFYEKMCRISEKILRLKVKPQTAEQLQTAIDTCHLQVTPGGVLAASLVWPILFLMIVLGVTLGVFDSMFFALFGMVFAVGAIAALQKVPILLANSWRLKSSNQMVLCIFYVVTYMRHTSNLELAIEFASEHLAPPLSLDLRKVIWDVENGKYESVKQSLEMYLQGWRQYNLEFVESFHLIQSSLYETSEDRRLSLLDKSLDVMLDETYEKMLHYAQNLKGPITMIYMLGVILPILGLVILPLVVSFMEGIAWYHIAAGFNVALPLIVYFMGKSVLSQRPTGYGDTDLSETNPELRKYRNIVFKVAGFEVVMSPAIVAVAVGLGCVGVALSPLILHELNPDFELAIDKFKLLDYKESKSQAGVIIGPFGLGASMLSLFFPAALALGLGLYFRLKSANVIKIRDEAKKLEDEFSSALFQLGNRLGDGIPAEIAFQKVSQVMEDTVSGKFFKLVSTNISRLGMSVRDALFDLKVGAVTLFPSAIIQSSMKVLIESVKKGPLIAAQALLNVARYIKEIHKVNERLKDLMADIISDMKSQIAFLTPAIAGIVIGITSMITYILGNLSGQISNLGSEQAGSQIGALANFFGDSIPTYYFQAVVGIYVFQIVYILTVLSNGVENGADTLQERYLLGKNLVRGTLLYCFIAGSVMLLFNIIASRIVDVASIAVS
ncbi:hypothetical protein C4580_05890 [Candidatus Woesearchaeota archaeon]|nr:MAG: hypothetical protein C4580_05890 [Candidatus Woesearchaeota archaeon]